MTGSTTQDHTTADTHTDTHTGSHKADDTQGGCKKRASSRSAKAGLIIPIAKINNRLCAKKVVPRVGAMAAVQMTGVIQEFAKEILDVAGDFCKSSGKTRLMPEHVLKALRSAIDLNLAVGGVGVTLGNEMVNVKQALLTHAERAALSKAKAKAAADAAVVASHA